MTRHPALLTLCLALTACGSSDGGTPDGGANDAGTDATPLKTLGQSCGGDSECDSGNCVDGVCCDQPKTSCGTCMRCDLAASKGTCTAVVKGDAPREASECAGDAECGANTCNGTGGCDYKPLDTVCSETCSGGTFIKKGCGQTHRCDKQLQSDKCEPYVCNSAQTACLTACTLGQHCINGSACDLSQLHLKGPGQGTCVDPSKVETVGTGTAIAAAIANAKGNNKDYVLIPAGAYTENLTIDGQAITLIGDGNPTIKSAASKKPVIAVTSSSTVTVQGLTLTDATGTDGDGIGCGGASTLTVLDSTIKDNAESGIQADNCDVTVRRSRIEANNKGGLKLDTGFFNVVNTLVVRNVGAPAVAFLGTAANSIFAHNTIADNTSSGGVANGIVCDGNENFFGVLLFNNKNTGATSKEVSDNCNNATCSYLVADPSFVGSTYVPAVGSVAVDKCDANLAKSATDLGGLARVNNGKLDYGAYEVH